MPDLIVDPLQLEEAGAFIEARPSKFHTSRNLGPQVQNLPQYYILYLYFGSVLSPYACPSDKAGGYSSYFGLLGGILWPEDMKFRSLSCYCTVHP